MIPKGLEGVPKPKIELRWLAVYTGMKGMLVVQKRVHITQLGYPN